MLIETKKPRLPKAIPSAARPSYRKTSRFPFLSSIYNPYNGFNLVEIAFIGKPIITAGRMCQLKNKHVKIIFFMRGSGEV
jgi:hypothetical protein